MNKKSATFFTIFLLSHTCQTDCSSDLFPIEQDGDESPPKKIRTKPLAPHWTDGFFSDASKGTSVTPKNVSIEDCLVLSPCYQSIEIIPEPVNTDLQSSVFSPKSQPHNPTQNQTVPESLSARSFIEKELQNLKFRAKGKKYPHLQCKSLVKQAIAASCLDLFSPITQQTAIDLVLSSLRHDTSTLKDTSELVTYLILNRPQETPTNVLQLWNLQSQLNNKIFTNFLQNKGLLQKKTKFGTFIFECITPNHSPIQEEDSEESPASSSSFSPFDTNENPTVNQNQEMELDIQSPNSLTQHSSVFYPMLQLQTNNQISPSNTRPPRYSDAEAETIVQLTTLRSNLIGKQYRHKECTKIVRNALATGTLHLFVPTIGQTAVNLLLSSLRHDTKTLKNTAKLVMASMLQQPDERPTRLEKLSNLNKKLKDPSFTKFLRDRNIPLQYQ